MEVIGQLHALAIFPTRRQRDP